MKKRADIIRRGAWMLIVLSGLLMSVSAAVPSFAADKASDQDITYWVTNALQHDERVDASKLAVKTEKGIVSISGGVDNIAAKNFAVMEAKKIQGVMGVLDDISVTPVWVPDADIRDNVRRRILNSASIEADGISVTADDGQVTLTGRVASWSEFHQAGLVASEVRGVKSVKNDITTRWSTTRDDAEIKNDAVSAIERDVYLSDLPIIVSVAKGVVTLSGSVGSLYEKDKAHDDVRWISHVKDVKDNLVVEPWKNFGTRKKAAFPNDELLKEAVRSELSQDSRIDMSKVIINVSYGHVTLHGSVATHFEKHVAEKDARDVVGVGWVTNNLFADVDKRADWLIRGDVEFGLRTDYAVGGFDIDVEAKDGVVTLSGDVHSWYEKTHAGTVAVMVKGVKEVINEIAVHRSSSKLDAELAKDVRSRLTWNWATWRVHKDIKVRVVDGVAILTGNVDSWAKRREAQTIAFHTRGIWRVDNRLTVNGYSYPWTEWYFEGPYVFDPYYTLYWPYEYDYWYGLP